MPIAVRHEQIHFDFGFRADLLVDDLVVKDGIVRLVHGLPD